LGGAIASPTGTVTFLFTDIEGSTKLAQEYPEEMPALLARHNEILNQTIQAHNGYVFQIVGDSFSAAFHSASDALNAALEAQRSLHNEEWSPASIKVRMGIHTGAAQLINDTLQTGYSGYATLALTQRIMSAGHGGQILLSGATRELVRDTLPVNSDLLDLGEKRLKDLLRPERLYQLNASGLPTTFPPLKTLDLFPNNLPIQLTTFIGRENQIAEVKQELNEHRLVTLTGSGGTGKTRLSLQVAADLLEKFDHGIWFIELAPLADPELIPQTILSAIGISEQPGKETIVLLKEYLHEKKTLIVLDNCEHLIEASAKVANTLLNAAPELKILASSREALGVKGELSYPVPSLSLPDPKHLPAIEQLSQYEAVRLFIDRASLVSPHFDVNKENAPAIAQICYRLDGIPLAIELAAARVKMMSVEQISKRLDDRFRLLTGGTRTSLPRQQTLRALIDWSYDILTENERLLLRRLSAFAGGWTLEASEDVCSGDGIETYEVLDLLTQLVNKSLVVVIEHSQSGETRYRMLETIRQYAREKLLEAGESEILRDRHLTYYVKLTKQAEPELFRSNQVFWLNKLDDEVDNLRLALDWSLARNVEAGLQLMVTPQLFWDARSDFREVESWLAQFLEHYNKADSLRARGLLMYGQAVALGGDFEKAREIGEQSLELSRAISDKQTEALGLWSSGMLIAIQGDNARGIPILEQSLALYRSLEDKFGQATVMAWMSLNSNDLDHSKAHLFESLQLFRELGHLSGIAVCLSELAHRTIWGGDFSSPVPWLEEARELHRQLGNTLREGDVIGYYGLLAYWQADFKQARAYYEESEELYQKVGHLLNVSWSRVNIAYVVLRQGEYEEAKKMFRVCVQQFQKANNTIALIYAMEGLASLNVNQGQAERATQLFAWADAMREKIGDHRPPVEQASVERDLVVIHSKLDDTAYAKAYAEGKGLTIEDVGALALEE
jgi:predicted ATPase/class 3 adenylate cyclase